MYKCDQFLTRIAMLDRALFPQIYVKYKTKLSIFESELSKGHGIEQPRSDLLLLLCCFEQ